jgi:hypothetical protein
LGKAIVGAAQALNCMNVKATDGTFMEEARSGAVAIIENKKVSVGTLEWVQRLESQKKMEESAAQCSQVGGLVHRSRFSSSRRKRKSKVKQRFGDGQIKSLEIMFEAETKPEAVKKVQLATELGLQPHQVAIWFQNKREGTPSQRGRIEKEGTGTETEGRCCFSCWSCNRGQIGRLSFRLFIKIFQMKYQSIYRSCSMSLSQRCWVW